MIKPNEEKTHCGFVAIIGATNAGKSTLVNRLVGAKVSITTHKVQTTRSNVRGVMVKGNTQVVLIDTPGLFKPKRRFDRAMHKAAEQSIEGCDVAVFVVDASVNLHEGVHKGLAMLKEVQIPVWLVLNKVDRLRDKKKLLHMSSLLFAEKAFAKSFMISSVKGRQGGRGGGGFREFEQDLVEAMPEGAWHFSKDVLSDVTDRQFASELTRERLMSIVHEELPFSMTVVTKSWQRKGKLLHISQEVVVQNDRHKGIVLGKGGGHLTLLGKQSRLLMEKVFEQQVHLELWVRVSSKWDEDKKHFEEWGLSYDV